MWPVGSVGLCLDGRVSGMGFVGSLEVRCVAVYVGFSGSARRHAYSQSGQLSSSFAV